MSDPLYPYKDLYAHPVGPGDHRPTAVQVVRNEGLVNKLHGKVALVTGGTSGAGTETARALHVAGMDVYFTARDAAKGASTLDYIRKNSDGTGKLEFVMMDMDTLASVKDAATKFLEKSGSKLNILVNNAGIMGCPESTTADGIERQFGVNHLAHFVLTVRLLPALLASSASTDNSRVVVVSSSSHRYSTVQFDNINLKGKYDPFLAYGQSKTANLWMANYLDRVYGERGLHALSLNPGGIWSGLQRYSSEEKVAAWKADAELDRLMLSPEQGAATSVWAALAKVWEGKGGKYLTECSPAGPAEGDPMSAMNNGYGPHAYDTEGEDRLWELSCELSGVRPEV